MDRLDGLRKSSWEECDVNNLFWEIRETNRCIHYLHIRHSTAFYSWFRSKKLWSQNLEWSRSNRSWEAKLSVYVKQNVSDSCHGFNCSMWFGVHCFYCYSYCFLLAQTEIGERIENCWRKNRFKGVLKQKYWTSHGRSAWWRKWTWRDDDSSKPVQ